MKTHTFANGFKVVYSTSDHASCIRLFCKVGSINESTGFRGMSHFIEHMCFNGTINKTNKTISEQFSKNGSFFNAYTVQDHTCYMINCIPEDTVESINTLADMIINSTFDPTVCRLEEKIVLEEVKRDDDNPASYVKDKLNELLYSGSAFEYAIDCVNYHPPGKYYDYDNILAYYFYHYQPYNMVLSISTPSTWETVLNAVKKSYFNTLAYKFVSDVKFQENCVISPAIETPRISVEYKRGGLKSNIIVGFRICNMFSDEIYPVELIKYILYGPDTSRIYQTLRQKLGLIYGCEIEMDLWEKMGAMTIYCDVENRNICELLKQLKKIVDTLHVDEKELEIVKGYVRGMIEISPTYLEEMTEYNGLNTLYNKPSTVSYEDLYESRFSHITVDQINELIKKYFNVENMCVYVLSGKKDITVGKIREIII